MQISIVNKSNNPLPKQQTEGSAGIDLYANLGNQEASIVIKSTERVLIPTGIHIQLPVGYVAQVCPRSSLALKQGVTVLNGPGTIDADYTGDVGVILVNLGNTDVTINHGDRIAQIVILKHESPTWNILNSTEEFQSTARGDGGFGSTGV